MVKYQTVEEKPKNESISKKKETKSNNKMYDIAVSRIIKKKQFTKLELDYILKCVNNYLSNYRINVTRKPNGEAARMYSYIRDILKPKVRDELDIGKS